VTPHDPHVAVDCFVRSAAAVKSVDDAIRTLREYDADGTVDELWMDRWPAEVRQTDEVSNGTVLTQYGRLRRWSDDNGVSLEPAFTRRERTTLVGDESDTFLRLPVLCLAIHVDGEFVGVAPHSTETGVYTVTDALTDIDTLSRDGDPADVPEFSLSPPVRTATTQSDGPEREERSTKP
jgi:hypothetical protein